MNQRPSHRPVLAAALLAALALLGGCGSASQTTPLTAGPLGPPLPSGAAVLPPDDAPTTATLNCAAAGSLRPTADAGQGAA